MMNSRQKGARGERELASLLRNLGFKTRRGQQYSGANGDADVVGLPGIHMEVKRVEKLNIYDAIDQAKRDARDGELPTVFHRKNHAEWLVTMTLEDWVEIYREWVNQEAEVKEPEAVSIPTQDGACSFCGHNIWIETRVTGGSIERCARCGAVRKKDER